jgi:nitrite reductase (NADH) large subunit
MRAYIGVKKEELPLIWRDLGSPSGHAYGKSYRTCKSCIGTDFCRFGVGDSTSLAIRIETKMQGIQSPHKMKMATAGCPRNCSEAMVKDFGAVAVEGGKWELYVGGAAGSHVRKGDLLCTVNSHEDVMKYMSRFIQYYRENGKYLERTYGFVERIGIERIRSIVVDDSEGIGNQLEKSLEESAAAYRDPWKEAYAPRTPNQFASVLPILQ